MSIFARITYYDFSNLLYASFYLAGLAQNAGRFGYQFTVTRSAPPRAHFPPGVQWAHILLFKVTVPDDEFYFCIDTRDTHSAGEYHVSLLERVKYYFKVNYNKQAIDADSRVGPSADRIVPVLPFFPIRDPKPLQYPPRLIPNKAMGWTPMETLRRIKHLRDMPTLEQMRAMRGIPEDLDIFFVVNFSGKKEHAADDECRYLIMREIQKQPSLDTIVGFVGRQSIPGKFSDLQAKRYSLGDYLAQVARSRVAMYVRGLHDCLSFKFGQLLALGKPIAGQTIFNNRDNIMGHPYFDEQFRFHSAEDLVSHAVTLLGDAAKRRDIGESNARTFDESFAPEAVMSDALKRMGMPKLRVTLVKGVFP